MPPVRKPTLARVPENPKFSHVESRLDTGRTVNKVRGLAACLVQAECAFENSAESMFLNFGRRPTPRLRHGVIIAYKTLEYLVSRAQQAHQALCGVALGPNDLSEGVSQAQRRGKCTAREVR